MVKNIKWLLLVSLIFVACNNDDEVVVNPNSSDGLPLTAGSANFSKYVALGDSFAAGFSDGALFKKGQEGSYPNVLAQQFALVGGGVFKTPLTSDNVGGLLFGGALNPAFGPRLYFNGSAPVPVSGTSTTEVFNPAVAAAGPYNNTGVPGAKSFHLLSDTYGSPEGLAGGTANPYYVRFAPNGTTSVLAYAASQTPTFFSLWIGENDVLGYALAGGVTKSQDPVKGDDITPTATFDFAYSTLIAKLTEKGAKGVVANLPYVSAFPFFTTVPTNPVPLDATNAATLNGLFGPLNGLFASLGETTPRFATLSASATNQLLIIDETLTPRAAAIKAALTPTYGPTYAGLIGDIFSQARHASNVVGSKDYILLSTRGVIGKPVNGVDPNTTVIIPPFGPFKVLGVSYPLVDRHVLTADEALQLKVATDAYNVTIKAIADSKGLAFVDTKAVMDQLVSGGIAANGFTVTNIYVTGGGFSLDGVHPSPRGYALIANKFLEAINAKYGSNSKGVNLGDYRILFPSSL